MLQRRTQGSSLIEILVVMIILVIGIFSVVRIFPYGFISLQRTGERAMAQQLARQMLERLKGTPENLPGAIYAVQYRWINGNPVVELDPTIRPDDLGYDPNFDPSVPVESYRFLSDINRCRRIVGESCRVPAPTPVMYDKNNNLIFGGLYQLQFGPIINDFTTSSGQRAQVFVVYGSDLSARYISSDTTTDLVQPSRGMYAGQECFIDPDRGMIWCPAPTPNSGGVWTWRVAISLWIKDASGLHHVDYVRSYPTNDQTGDASNGPSWGQFPGSTGLGIHGWNLVDPQYGIVQNGETLVSVDWGSVHVAREFDAVPAGGFTAGNPYQYQLVDDKLGMVVFNPSGYNFKEQRQRRLIPLRANFDYDVFDWHILTDERTVSTSHPFNVKLTLNRIRRTGEMGEDQVKFPGMGLPGYEAADVLCIDTTDGSVLINTPKNVSFTFDQLAGLVHFNDQVFYLPLGADPGNVSNLPSRSPAGRTYRILYMGMDYWGVQVQKAPQSYSILNTWNGTLGVAQAYVELANSPHPNFIWFPACDIGKTIVLRRYYYLDANKNPQVGANEEFVINADQSLGTGLGYIDIGDSEHHRGANGFNYSPATGSAYPVDSIVGGSLKVRVIWAPTLRERSDAERKLSYPLVRYLPEWRKIDFDTHLVKEVEQ